MVHSHDDSLRLGLINGCRRTGKIRQFDKLLRCRVYPAMNRRPFRLFLVPGCALTSVFPLPVYHFRFTTSGSKTVFLLPSSRMRPPTTTVPSQVHSETSVTTYCEFPNCNMHPSFCGTTKASPLLGACHFVYDPGMLAAYVSGVSTMMHTVPLTTNKAKRDKCKKVACEICKKMFLRPSALKVHMRVHSGERPFKCTHCPRTFTQSGNLTVHLRKHSGERPFACTICLKRFSQSNSLRVHIRRHTGEKPYQCRQCKNRFADRYSQLSIQAFFPSLQLVESPPRDLKITPYK